MEHTQQQNAALMVDEVFEKCYRDYDPLPGVP
jgi:hypothetical protein